jgi:hypothetical protein
MQQPTTMNVYRLRNIWIVSCALQSVTKQQQILLSKPDESPLCMLCWILEPLPVDQQSKMTCMPGFDSSMRNAMRAVPPIVTLIMVDCYLLGSSAMEGSRVTFFKGRVLLQ